MIESISEVPHISDAFYYAFCGGGKSGKGGKKGKRFDLTSPEARAELFAAT
jgi:hypothetical protein